MNKESRYILKRKIKAFFQSLPFYACRVFPVNKNRITVCSFEGRGGFGCNPKYIVQKLHELYPECEIIWFVNDISKIFPDYIKKVKNTALSRAFYLTTSKIWIDNYRKPYGTCKRKGQYYINTWHANIGFKSIGLLRGNAFSKMAYLVSKNDSDMIDDVVIDSTFCDILFRKGLIYNGRYQKVGQPRCDILYGDRSFWKKRFRERFLLPEDAKIIMYAPTFREGVKNGKRVVFSEIWTIDFNRMLDSFSKRFGGKWYLCVRLHPQLANTMQYEKNNNNIIDVSQDDDMYELLAAMDAFITDYSSAAMDASYCGMPVFIYADDIEKYRNDRGNLLWYLQNDTEKEVRSNQQTTPNIDVVLPYPIAKNNDELENRILNFDEKKYKYAMNDFKQGVGLVFNGNASEKIAKLIINQIN